MEAQKWTTKIEKNIYADRFVTLLGAKKGQKMRANIHTHMQVPKKACKPSFMVAYYFFFRKRPKTPKYSQFSTILCNSWSINNYKQREI